MMDMTAQPIVMALTKGRILEEVMPLLAETGIHLLEDYSKSRKLIFDTNVPGRMFRPTSNLAALIWAWSEKTC